MKIQFTNEMKRIVTVAEMPSVRSVIESERDDEWTAKEWAKDILAQGISSDPFERKVV